MRDETVLERILNGDEEPKDLPLALLQDITNDFCQENKIGEGGFGEVYKGVLRNGVVVAVKRIHINVDTIDDKLFRREFNSLWKANNHQNVVRFLGFCSNTHRTPRKEAGQINLVNVRERLLCFEYISNGCLDKHITDELRGLEWETRYEIISGICKGLFYLHKEQKIVHMDLKPPNILLDDHMVPKITDFGLSRSNENSHTTGQRFGTSVYVAPEYKKDGKTSFKCDIYSLGVVITELVAGCKSVPHENNVLRRWRHRWSKPPTLLQYQQVTRCINIAVRCRQQEPKDRPAIGDIINFLCESESTDGHTSQESTYLDDDMLGIEPLELHFSFKLNKEMACSVKLTNKTKACFAFSIERPSKQYTIRPEKGIVPPECNEYLVQITVQSQESAPQVTHNVDKFIVHSTKVSKGLRDEDITENIFHEEGGKVVDEVNLMVVYETGSRKRGQDPNMPVEAVSPKAISPGSYEDGARGQLDRRNFHPPENFSHRQPTNETYLLRGSDRAVDVTRGAMGSLLHKLGELLKEEFNLETSVKKDVQSLSEELVKMQPVLRKVSDVQQDNLDDLVKRWASNVREMSYDIEDFVDGFLVHSESDSNMSGSMELTHEKCLLLDKGKSDHLISDSIKDISKKVQHEAKKRKEYNVDYVVANASAKAVIDVLRISARYEPKAQLVGIETPRDEIIRLFEEDGDVSKQNLKIVSIVGLGGLGKTTLAKAVYDELKAQFNHKTFVSVGQNPDVKKVLEKLIRKIVNEKFNENLDVEELIEVLQESLEDKRYFIVIDDIWDSEAWGLIQSAFPETERGSRVITTTRNHDVALATCNAESENVYRIKPLSDEDSRTLFFRRTFGPKKGCPDTPRKEEISIDILKRCGGMPLAVNSIASLLAGKTDSTWEYAWKSLGAITEGDDHEKMKQILDLSYIHLPEHLKTCLLYVCMYPEDREIDKNDLLRLWVAEGFVSTNGRLDAEDVAEKYFKELINMCMIQPGKIDDYSNEVLSCRVHDIILDLMRSKSSKENFIHVIDGSKDEAGEIRRVSVHRNDKEDTRISETSNKGSLSHVRSVLLCWSSLVDHFLESKYVRVLHLELRGIGGNIDLTGISRLFLLRYLKVASAFGIELKLPNQIGALQQLEIIDIYGCELRNYPSDIVSLPWLSHLSSMGSVLPDGVDRLTSLRTLAGVHLYGSSVENVKGLGKLTNLRKLRINSFGSSASVEETTMDALHYSICKLSANLRIFTLKGALFYKPSVPDWFTRTPSPWGSHIQELDLQGCRYERCPKWIGQLHGLYKLCISVRGEVADGVSIVARLPSLAYFYLGVFYMGEEEKEESVVIPGTGNGAFRALKELSFCCPMASLTFEAGAMPKLEKLDILFRFHMTPQLLPVGIQHLPAGTLKIIWLRVGNAGWLSSRECADDSIKLGPMLKSILLKRAFKQHHPGADIDIYVEGMDKYIGDGMDKYIGDDEDEDFEGVDQDEDYEEDYNEDDEATSTNSC